MLLTTSIKFSTFPKIPWNKKSTFTNLKLCDYVYDYLHRCVDREQLLNDLLPCDKSLASHKPNQSTSGQAGKQSRMFPLHSMNSRSFPALRFGQICKNESHLARWSWHLSHSGPACVHQQKLWTQNQMINII